MSNRARRRQIERTGSSGRGWGWIPAGLAVLVLVGVFLTHRPVPAPVATTSTLTPQVSSQAPTNPLPASGPAVGQLATSGSFVTLTGQRVTFASLIGKPTLLWFVTTWCGSCQASTQTIAQNMSFLSQHGVRVVEMELYDDLGSPGPSLASMQRAVGSTASASDNWIWGTASESTSLRYDPQGYLDIYYLVSARGTIQYVNSTPIATMGALRTQISSLDKVSSTAPVPSTPLSATAIGEQVRLEMMQD